MAFIFSLLHKLPNAFFFEHKRPNKLARLSLQLSKQIRVDLSNQKSLIN